MSWRGEVLGKAAFIILGWIGACSPASADTVQDFGGWTGVFIQGKLSESFSLYLEEQIRLNTEVSAGNRFILRPAIQYSISPELSTSLGYGWTPNFSPFRNENRIWQQVQYVLKADHLQLSNRIRFEQRMIQNADGTSLRFRYLIRGNLYLNPNTKRLALCIGDEIFFQLNGVSGGPPFGFDQNRAFIGLNFVVNDELTLESGYLNLYDTYTIGVISLLGHIYVLNMYLNF
jgi:hypothetical protein